MDKNQQDKHNQHDSMSIKKNYLDYDKQRRNSKNSTQNKSHQLFNDEEMENKYREIAAKTSGGTTSNAWNKNQYEDDIDHGKYYDSNNQNRK